MDRSIANPEIFVTTNVMGTVNLLQRAKEAWYDAGQKIWKAGKKYVQVRIGRVKERIERGKEREVNKVSCSLLVRALWPVVHIRRRLGTKGSQLRPLGLVHWQASWPLSTPSGQDVSLSKEESLPELPFVAGRRTPSRARNWALV